MKLYRKVSGTALLMILNRGLTLLSGIFIARTLGPESFGVYTFLLAFTSVVNLPAIAGVQYYVVREVAKLIELKNYILLEGLISWSRSYILIMSLIFLVVGVLIFPIVIEDERSVTTFILLLLTIPLRSLIVHQSAILNGMAMPVISQISMQVIMPLILFVCIIFNMHMLNETSVNIIAIFYLFSVLIAAVFGEVILRKKSVIKIPSYERNVKYKEGVKSLMSLGAIAILTTLNTEMGTLALGFFSTSEQVAYFKVALQAVLLITLSLTAINTVIMPRIAKHYQAGECYEVQLLLTQSVRLVTLLSMSIILILIFIGEKLIQWLFGMEYMQAYPIILILCVGQVANVMLGSAGLVMSMTNNEKYALKVMLVSTLILVALIVPLSLQYGAGGAAIAVSVGLVFWNVSMSYIVYKKTSFKTWIQ
jgi:O-antigen/teichoic acid export membrane protein